MRPEKSLLKKLGWQQHQALFVCHDDKAHPHLHMMVCAVHPETGRKLVDAYERRWMQDWALEYERTEGRIYCEERLYNRTAREKSPLRTAWEQCQQEVRKEFKAEVYRSIGPDHLKHIENRDVIKGEEWNILKEFQTKERMAFFAGGKEAYSQAWQEAHSTVRSEYQKEWNHYFTAKRSGMDRASLQPMRANIAERQKREVGLRTGQAVRELRAQRDAQYADMKVRQQEQRHELHDRQKRGLNSPDLLDLVNRYREVDLKRTDIIYGARRARVDRRQAFRHAAWEDTGSKSNDSTKDAAGSNNRDEAFTFASQAKKARMRTQQAFDRNAQSFTSEYGPHCGTQARKTERQLRDELRADKRIQRRKDAFKLAKDEVTSPEPKGSLGQFASDRKTQRPRSAYARSRSANPGSDLDPKHADTIRNAGRARLDRRQPFEHAAAEATSPKDLGPNVRDAYAMAAEHERVRRESAEELGSRLAGFESAPDGTARPRSDDFRNPDTIHSPDVNSSSARTREAHRQSEEKTRDEVDRLLHSWTVRQHRSRGRPWD